MTCVDADIVSNAIEESGMWGNLPMLADLENGYAVYRAEGRYECNNVLVFCNWDLCGDGPSDRCELRIDSPGNRTLAQITLNGLSGRELTCAVREFISQTAQDGLCC